MLKSIYRHSKESEARGDGRLNLLGRVEVLDPVESDKTDLKKKRNKIQLGGQNGDEIRGIPIELLDCFASSYAKVDFRSQGLDSGLASRTIQLVDR